MRCESIDATDTSDLRLLASRIRALIPAGASVADAVAEIVAAVRERGDEAVLELTRRFDSADAPAQLQVPPHSIERAGNDLPADVRAGLELAIDNVRRVAQAGLQEDRTVKLGQGHEIALRHAAVDRAAVYVPGGRAPYPSTVVMGAVTAAVAGVGGVSVCSPPGPDGEVHPVVLGACALAGVTAVYRMGGAQAVAALAYGTASVEPVDVIVGPGSLYVQEAKRQVSDRVGIDGFAGPSDLVVVAGADADPEPLALDLLAQAEHGPGTLVVALSDSAEVLSELGRRLGEAPETGAVSVLVRTADSAAAVALARALAPEHLELVGREVEALADAATQAGCVFVGPGGATAFGDYIAGSNHVLPTGGAARFASGLNPGHFRRAYAEVRLTPGEATDRLARAAAPIARAEGFELHARSMEARIRDNRPR